ncbi:hypothetical protein SacmaDRAFT_4678 [Saccharomonospora marina XMU15]|uniref:Uncharacterized protein n=1 Tax=Saccharomonospora marina XMU15 TaxID=882083 RepID=H5WXY5_9PSEU|nr:hypothetical protein [Saccharomonospora marina]EHR52852.1 hypothetical protein SacmaDRAFT_4678 [Saccharomonospora marina XMU15]
MESDKDFLDRLDQEVQKAHVAIAELHDRAITTMRRKWDQDEAETDADEQRRDPE